MLFSFSLILILGFILSGIFARLKIPGLLAMILTGIILGPHMLNLISPDIYHISADLREIALIVILTRAGLSLNIQDLKKVGRPAILMCFVPATIELTAYTLLAPPLLHISYVEAAIMGAVLGAVSPAVIVPRMLQLMEQGYGAKKCIPQLIMAGTSVDGIYLIVLFTAFIGMYHGEGFHASTLISIPISIVLGLILGVIVGLILIWIFKKFHMRDTVKVLLILSTSFLFVTLESAVKPYIPISGLLAVVSLSGTILNNYNALAKRLTVKFSKIWVAAEVVLFVLVGAMVDTRFLAGTGVILIILILCALVGRIIGVLICLLKTELTFKERLFCIISYLPKATVQAAIGGIPLAAGVPAGNVILTAAVLSIFITAPLGALGIDHSYKKLLK